MPTQSPSDFATVHARLKQIMQMYEREPLRADPDEPDHYALVGPPTEQSRGKALWFGAVQTRKRYVSSHLMAVYVFPDLLTDISPELRKRMQGKACFNFRQVDEELFQELAELTARGYQRLKDEKWITDLI